MTRLPEDGFAKLMGGWNDRHASVLAERMFLFVANVCSGTTHTEHQSQHKIVMSA